MSTKSKKLLDDYKKNLREVYVKLAKLQKKLLQQNKRSLGYLNTTCSEMLSLISFFILILDEKIPYYNKKTVDEKWFLDQIQMMHRIFISSLHLAIESALKSIIKDKKIKIEDIEISRNKQINSIISLISNDIAIKKLIKLEQKEPSFKDYLEAVFKNTNFNKNNFKKEFQNYFSALAIIRNKISHSYSDGILLNNSQVEILEKANWNKMIDENNKLQFNPHFYYLIINDVTTFFEVMENNK